MNMKAAICYDINKPLVVEDRVTVDSPGKREVKVRIAVTAVCHSDLHFIKGEIPFKLPGLAGHEIAGYSGGGSIRPGIDIPALVSLYQSGRLKLDELITAKYPLSRIDEAIESLDKDGALRNLIMF
jgi:Zn-dependent alcohol dehydrogenase